MIISSPVFENNGKIPKEYSCEGEGYNPPLTITDVPKGAKALALIVDDPDAPIGLFTHWVLWNIPPETKVIERDSSPEGAVEGNNSLGETNWIAPCPPNGLHHYRFQLYSLSQPLTIKSGSSRDVVEREIEKYDIDRAELVGIYQKNDPTA